MNIPEDLKELYAQANVFSSHLSGHETVDGMIVRLIKRIAAQQEEIDRLKVALAASEEEIASLKEQTVF